MEKIAQHKFEDFPFLAEVSEEPKSTFEEPKDTFHDVELRIPEKSVEDVYEEKSPEGEKELVFKLEEVPGANPETLEVLENEPEPVEVDEKTQTPLDDWDWEGRGLKSFLGWVQDRFKSIPKHSGQDTTGIERCLAYFQKLDVEISRAMRKDYRKEIDAAKAEEARMEIAKGMDRLIERLERLRNKKFKSKTKKAMDGQDIVKTADKMNYSGKTFASIPYFVSIIARACLEATVQGGKDIEDVYKKMAADYKLNKRERFEVVNLIKDMGYPIMLDRVNFEEDIKPSESKPSEYITQYYS